jgi:hypothetical protein
MINLENKFSRIIPVIIIIGLIILSIIGCLYPKSINLLTLIVLTLTLIILCYYAIDTNRIANKAEDDSLKPLVLRSGFLDWNVNSIEDINKNMGKLLNLEFVNIKNIALNINGYIVIENKKYTLLFGNIITTEQSKIQENDLKKTTMKLLPKWGWLPMNGSLSASFHSKEFIGINSENCIELTYYDIEGNMYYTREDSNFSQTSKRLKTKKHYV